MANCIIHPVPLYQIKYYKSLMTYLTNFNQQGIRAEYVWYIEGTREKILVDAGDNADFHARYVGTRPTEIQTLDQGLDKLGISFSDIDLIILTHLHFDHVAQASRFPKARVLIQRDELQFAQNPHPAAAWPYCKEFFDGLNFEVVRGDTKISDEVSVISTPGHTPGGQSVAIKTAQGLAIIAGLCTVRDNFEPPPRETLPVIAPGIHTNALEAYDSILRIKETADIVISLHDSEFVRRNSIP